MRHFVLGFAIDFYNGYYSLSRKKPLVLFQLESEMCTTNESNILFPFLRVMGLFWSDWREGAVLFVTYLWGKPQLRRRRRMRRGQNSPMDKSLKRPGREARNERKVP